MRKKWPELVLSSKESRISKEIGRAVKAGFLRKIAPRIYTSNLADKPEDVIKRNQYQLLGLLYPRAVISYRSAFEGGISKEGEVILSYKYTKVVQLPGLTIRLIQGKGPDPEDSPFLENLYIASRGRAFLENLKMTRQREGFSKVVTMAQLEERLDRLARIYGREELNKVRDQAREVSKRLKMKKEFIRLDKMIGSLFGTKSEHTFTNQNAQFRAQGEPFDPARIELFATLAAYLQQEALPIVPSKIKTKESLVHQAFFESYFSNYIEGTRFEIEEAEKIVFEHKVISHRKEDSHDILSTYQMVSDRHLMQTVPQSVDELISLLLQRHSNLMAAREDKMPGKFKDVNNRAGDTLFVAPEEVRGTFIKGFSLYQQLTPGIARALYMMFFVAEIHPFIDGNGRIARIMMNAELEAVKQSRIMIPTVYREDYLLALKRLSRQNDPTVFVKMMIKAQAFNASISFESYTQALMRLKASNAFLEPNEGKLVILGS